VVIATAHGGKFSSTTLGYHSEGAAGAGLGAPNPPRVLPPELDAIKGALQG
jgi:hypothetical protein